MNEVEGVIEVSQLRFGWQAPGPLVLDIEALSVSRGERLFIEGASGSGKSTLLSLLAGVLLPQQGNIQVLGRPINRLSGAERDRFRADHIGLIFQLFNLIPYLSVLENVTLPCRFSPARRAQATRRGKRLEDEAVRLLTHLDLTGDRLLSRPVTALSVGQQQRVAAARALIGSPALVLADEPTSSLDADRREAFVQLLFQECNAERLTLVLVSHDSSLKQFFDRTVRLVDINRASDVARV